MTGIFKLANLIILLFLLPLSADKMTQAQLEQIQQKVQKFAQHERGGGVAVAVVYPDSLAPEGWPPATNLRPRERSR